MSFCKHCGTKLSVNAAFCPKCGKEVPRVTSAKEDSDPFQGAAIKALIPINRTILSVISGYLGLLSILPFVGFVSAFVGCWALYDLKKKPEKDGKIRVWFGLIMGVISTFVWFCFLAF